MGRLIEFIVLAVIAIVISHVLKVMIKAGFFTQTLNHSPGPCRVIQANGSEDLALLPDGLAFVSSVFTMSIQSSAISCILYFYLDQIGNPDHCGTLKSSRLLPSFVELPPNDLRWLNTVSRTGMRYKVALYCDPEIDKRDSKLLTFDFNKPDQDPVELTLKNFNRTGFNPHGISVYREPSSGQVSLFVINHRPDAQAIEIFDFERETHSLIHRRSVVDDLIWSPNNLYAVGPDSFYVTNDNFFHFDSTVMRSLWIFLLNYWLHCDIVFFDGFKGVEAIGGVHPNGIAMDKDERFVFTPDHISLSIAIYRRLQDNTLEKCQTIPIGSIIDNINVDPVTGDLWLAGIPRGIDFVEHSKNLSLPSPSQVLHLQLGKRSSSGEAFPDYQLREVYMNDGKEVSGSSSAIFYKDRLLIGSVYSNMVYCEVKYY